MNRARYEKAALKACRDSGALVHFIHQKMPQPWGVDWNTDKKSTIPRWLVRVFGEEFFHQIGAVAFIGSTVGNSELKVLSELKALEDLSLQGQSHVADADLYHVAKISSLENLCLWGTSISDTGLTHLNELKALKGLGLSRTRVTDNGLLALVKFRHLTLLELDGTDVTDRGLIHLYDMKSLSSLNLHDTAVTRKGIEGLKKALPNCDIGVEREKSEPTP